METYLSMLPPVVRQSFVEKLSKLCRSAVDVLSKFCRSVVEVLSKYLVPLGSLGSNEALESNEALGSKRPKGPLRPRRLRDPSHGAPMVPPHWIPWVISMDNIHG